VADDGEVEDYKILIEEGGFCTPEMEVTKLVRSYESEDENDWADEYDTTYDNEIVKFNITIHNNCTCCGLTNISVLDILPCGMTYSPQGNNVFYNGMMLDQGYDYLFEEDGNNLYWNFTEDGTVASVPYCHSINIYFQAEVTDYGTWTNHVDVTANCDSTPLSEYDEAVVHLQCDMMPTPEGSKTVWCPVEQQWTDTVYDVQQGQTVKFNITAYNDGCCDLTEIHIKDILPVPNLQYVQTTKVEYPAGVTYQGFEQSGNNLYWNFTGNLPNDGSKIYIEFEAELVDTTGDYCGNQATISGRCQGTMTVADSFNYAYVYFALD